MRAHSLLSPQIDQINGGSSAKKGKREAAEDGVGDMVNMRKAVRFASGGQGAAAIARKSNLGGRQKAKGKTVGKV